MLTGKEWLLMCWALSNEAVQPECPRRAPPVKTELVDSPEMLTARQVAKLLGVSDGTLENWRRAGRGPPYHKIERCIRYSRKTISAYLKHTLREGNDPG